MSANCTADPAAALLQRLGRDQSEAVRAWAARLLRDGEPVAAAELERGGPRGRRRPWREESGPAPVRVGPKL